MFFSQSLSSVTPIDSIASNTYVGKPLWAFRPSLQPQPSRAVPPSPPGSIQVLLLEDEHGQYPKSDTLLLGSSFMSDCSMVICQDVKWSTHKTVLCGRNNWFSVALDGPFQEASAGVVTIEEFDPDTVQTVLNYIYTGAIKKPCSTPSEVLEIWKAGDFFGITDLVNAAQSALEKHLSISAAFLRFTYGGPARKPRNNTHCQPMLTEYGGCGHLMREPRASLVRNVTAQALFHLCEPQRVGFRPESCGRCGRPGVLDSGTACGSASGPRRVADQPAPPGDELRDAIEAEVRTLCEALIVTTVDTPQGSRMLKALIDHMCSTRVAAWGGYTVCRFLEV